MHVTINQFDLSSQIGFFHQVCALSLYSVSILLLELDLWDPKSSPHSPLSQKILLKLQVLSYISQILI